MSPEPARRSFVPWPWAWAPTAAPTVLAAFGASRLLALVGYWVARSDLITSGTAPRSVRDAVFRYDGAFYREIATSGYRDCMDAFAADPGASCYEIRRFFPGYPVVSRLLAGLTPFDREAALVVVAHLATLAALLAVWRVVDLVDHEDPRHRAAHLGVWLLALYPAMSVSSLAYAEPLALLATAVVVLAVARHRVVPGVVAGLLLGVTRPTGVLLVVLVGVAWWIDRRTHPPASFTTAEQPHDRVVVLPVRADRPWPTWQAAVVAAAPVAGLVAYLGWLGATLDAFWQPLQIQRHLRAGFHEPVSRLGQALWRTLTDDFRDGYNLVFAAFGSVLLVLAATRGRTRIPVAWTALGAVGLVVALSANNIDSLGRYLLAVFPAWLALLAWELRDRVVLRWVVLGAFSAGSVWMTVTTLRELVVP